MVLDRDPALPWLLGIADGLASDTRSRVLHRLVRHDEPAGGHADRVAGLVDHERRMSAPGPAQAGDRPHRRTHGLTSFSSNNPIHVEEAAR
jgi:hypothetical protein